MDKTEERQLEVLQKVYDTWMPSIPALKNRRCSIPDGMIAYISCSDVHDYKYNVRIVPVADFLDSDEKYEKTTDGEILSHYETLEELVADGWMLD